jgi:hypothetical protein
LLTVDAPDDETMTRANLALATQGNLRTTTLPGFREKEMETIGLAAVIGAAAIGLDAHLDVGVDPSLVEDQDLLLQPH